MVVVPRLASSGSVLGLRPWSSPGWRIASLAVWFLGAFLGAQLFRMDEAGPLFFTPPYSPTTYVTYFAKEIELQVTSCRHSGER
jgi:hypothetical protein